MIARLRVFHRAGTRRGLDYGGLGAGGEGRGYCKDDGVETHSQQDGHKGALLQES